MLTEALVSAVFDVVKSILGVLPDINIVIPERIIVSAAQFWSAACYILPMSTISAIFTILIGLQIFRIAVSLIKTLWTLLPLV